MEKIAIRFLFTSVLQHAQNHKSEESLAHPVLMSNYIIFPGNYSNIATIYRFWQFILWGVFQLNWNAEFSLFECQQNIMLSSKHNIYDYMALFML